MLKENANKTPLKLTWYSNWNSFSLLPAFIIRTIEKFSVKSRNTEFPRLPNFMNKTLIQLATIERKIIKKTTIPLGLSLIGVMTPSE